METTIEASGQRSAVSGQPNKEDRGQKTEDRRPVGGPPSSVVSLDGDARRLAVHYAKEFARHVRNESVSLRVLCDGAMMPAEAVHELESARAVVDDLMHYNGGAVNGPPSSVSHHAMLQVQRLRAALDELSRDIERWRVRFPDEEFPATVRDALMKEMERADRLHFRAVTLAE